MNTIIVSPDEYNFIKAEWVDKMDNRYWTPTIVITSQDIMHEIVEIFLDRQQAIDFAFGLLAMCGVQV